MLKGFVSGEEKDIKRIPMKGKNLFDVSTVEKGRIDNGEVGYAFQTSSLTIEGGTVSFTTTAAYRGVCSGFFEIPETGNLWFNFTTNKTLGVKFVFYDSSKTWLNADYIHTLTDPFPAMATIPTDAKYVRISFTGQITGGSDYTMSDIMLNLGSQPLPYEPYGYQEGWEVRDNQDRLIWGREDELQTATGTLPFKGYGLPVKVKSLLGNAVQNGTPAPDNIITPEMCGKLVGSDWTIPLTNAGQTIPVYLGEVPTVRRVKKLVLTGEEQGWVAGQAGGGAIRFRLSLSDITIQADTQRPTSKCTHFPLGVEGGTWNHDNVYTISYTSDTWNLWLRVANISTLNNLQQYLRDEYAAGHPVTVWYTLANEQTAISNEPLCKISTYADELTTIQVHGLSAPLYGIGDYKDTLNLSTGVVTRKVKKLVLTGTENWDRVGNTHGYFTTLPNTAQSVGVSGIISSHYQSSMSSADGTLRVAQGAIEVLIYDNYTSVSDFKAYLAAQYAAGTPVTIWYVLSTPETETVTVPTGMTGEIEGYLTQVSTPTPTNRSVPKWNGVEETGGTYAVTVYTPPEIPTTTGQNTLTVETEKIHGLTNPLCGIGDYKDVLNLSTGVITRKIKKLVLDGSESSWFVRDGKTSTFGVYLVGRSLDNPGMCSHYMPINAADFDTSTGFYVRNTGTLYVSDPRFTDISDFQAFLAAQYQNGTPVTVWYVPTEPETETIAVPYGLECSVEGYLTQSGTPTPSSPIDPTSNGILESGGTYAVEVSLAPSNLTVKGHIKELT